MRSAVLLWFSLVLLALPASAQKQRRADSLAIITKALEDFPLGTPAAAVRARKEFKYDEELKLTSAKFGEIIIFIEFEKDKVSRLAISDFTYAHKNLLKLLEEKLGEPKTFKVGRQTGYYFRKEGTAVLLNFGQGRTTSLQINAPEN